MHSVLHVAFAHHSWATLRLLDACARLDDAQLATTVPGTFGSIIDTLRHLVGADVGYLAFLGDLERIDDATMDVAAMRAAAERCGPAWERVLAGDLDPDRMLTRQHADGSTNGAPLGTRIAQALHHGSDHRSQVCTALTALGVEPPAIDVWDHAEAHGWLTETPATA